MQHAVLDHRAEADQNRNQKQQSEENKIRDERVEDTNQLATAKKRGKKSKWAVTERPVVKWIGRMSQGTEGGGKQHRKTLSKWAVVEEPSENRDRSSTTSTEEWMESSRE